MICKNIFIAFLLLLYSCSDKNTNELLVKQSYNIIELKDNDAPKIALSNKDFADNKSFSIDEERIYIGTWNFAYLNNEKYFFISPDNCTIVIIDKSGNYINGFSVKGKGFRLLKFINASVVMDTSIILYDSSLRKFVEYNYNGEFIKEIINNGSSFPYHISGIVSNKSSYFCMGIDNDGYQEYLRKKEYANFFQFDLDNLEVINKYSIFPDGFTEYLESDDIAASSISNPFNINLIGNKIYIYDWISGQVIYFALNDINSITKIKLSNGIFPKHIPLTTKKNTPKLSYEWFKSGAYLNNVFEDDKFLILYITVFNDRNNKIDKNIIFVDKKSMKIKYTLFTDEDKNLKLIHDNHLIFIGYENLKSYESGLFTVYKINYKKLF